MLGLCPRSNTLGAAGFGGLLVFLLPIFETGFLADFAFSALVGGGIASYLALRKDSVGIIARDVVGETSNKAVCQM